MTALATEVFLGNPSRFITAKQVASYIGMIPREYSSGQRQRLGNRSKQGNSRLRYLWTEAALRAVRKDPELKRFYRHKLIQKGMGKARIAAAGKLGIRLWYTHHAWHSCSAALAQIGKPKEALSILRKTTRIGLPDYPLFCDDPLLAPLRQETGFIQLMAELKTIWDDYRREFNRPQS